MGKFSQMPRLTPIDVDQNNCSRHGKLNTSYLLNKRTTWDDSRNVQGRLCPRWPTLGQGNVCLETAPSAGGLAPEPCRPTGPDCTCEMLVRSQLTFNYSSCSLQGSIKKFYLHLHGSSWGLIMVTVLTLGLCAGSSGKGG